MTYAQRTKVPVAKTKGEIEALVVKHGGDQFMSGWKEGMVQIAFRIDGRMLRFRLSMEGTSGGQQERQRWRALLLVIKAKFEAVESGIETLEEAFLANVVMADGATMAEWAKPQLALMYETADMPPLLTGPRS